MDKLNDEETAMSYKTKLEKINSFCESHRCAVKRIIQNIIEGLDKLPAKVKTFIDLLWKAMKKFDDRTGKSVMVEAMKIFGNVLSLVGLAFPVAGLLSRVVLLVASFLKIFFSVSDLKVMLKPESISMVPESFSHGINGLAEKIERTAIFIDAVDDEEHVDDSTLNDLISNVDIHIGIREIGDLRSRILSLMSGKQEEWMACLHFLTLFVKISTLRHILLFRMMTCLKMKKYRGTGTVKALQTYIEKEITDNHAFLAFFSKPTLENVGILTVFDPLVHTELATYVKEMGLNVQNLSTVLHNQVFLIQPFTDECIFLGRPLLSLSSVWSMSSSTNINNDRIKFKFTALENTFNEFYIQTPDTGQYIYLKDDRYCKYRDFTIIPDCARWRMIFVRETDDNEDLLSRVIFCTKQWPDRFLYLDNTYFKRAKGLPTDREASTKCLFMVRLVL